MANKPIPIITPEVEARFWVRVDRSEGQGPKGDCWHWMGACREDGYPRHIRVQGVSYRVGQIALLIVGRTPDAHRRLALHACDNPPCVRPEHLRWGSESENIADAAERGTGGRRGFTPDEVRYIRTSPRRHFELAREFHTSSACILNIRKRVTHKHIL